MNEEYTDDEWARDEVAADEAEPSRRVGLARRLGAAAGRRALNRGVRGDDGGARTTGPLVLMLGGAVAFAGALALDWAKVDVVIGINDNEDATTTRIVELATGGVFHISGAGTAVSMTYTTANNLTTVDMLGLLFGLGGLMLLTLTGGVLSRPELALRLRLTGSALGLGLVAVVLAGLARLPELLIAASKTAAFSPLVDKPTVSYEPGVLCAVLAVVLPVAAMWLRSWRVDHPAAAPVFAVDEEPVARSVRPAPRRPEPYDLTVTAEP